MARREEMEREREYRGGNYPIRNVSYEDQLRGGQKTMEEEFKRSGVISLEGNKLNLVKSI